MGNNQTSGVNLQHLKVCKQKVIDALQWLKIHHSEYIDITINESKLGWMNNCDEAFLMSQIWNFSINGKNASKSQQPSVSEVQCLKDDTNNIEMKYKTLEMNKSSSCVDPHQGKLIQELIDTTIKSNQCDKLLLFPSHGKNPVK